MVMINVPRILQLLVHKLCDSLCRLERLKELWSETTDIHSILLNIITIPTEQTE